MDLNWLDRAIASFSPRWAYKRMAWRSGMSLFDAGDRGRLNQNWNPAQSPDQYRASAERSLIRARAQDLERNSDLAAALISPYERNVVGSGIVLQAKIDSKKPGNENDELNHRNEKLWKEFCKAENCDVTGTQSMEEMEEMMIRRYIVDGGIFVIKVYVNDKRFPFKIQLRSVDELNTLVVSSDSRRIVEGVELDEYNKPIAYHFKKYDGRAFIPNETVRIEAKNVIFLYKKTSPQQVREQSMLATALPRIKDVNQFIEAVGIKERVLACMAVFIKKDSPSGMGRSVNRGQEISYDGVSLTPGMIGELNPGDEVQTVVPAGQASNAREFITMMIRLIAAGMGLSYEAVSRDLSMVNYSSARQGLIEDKKVYRKMQKMLMDKVLTPLYCEFLDSMYLTKQLDVPDYAQNKADYTAHQWIPPGSQWIDPTKEVNANKIALETDQDTLARICAERGEDWREVVKQRAAERKLIQQLSGGEDIEEEEEPTDDLGEVA